MSCTNCTPIVGMWACPIAKMAQWKAVGINTLMHFEPEGGRYTQAQWRAAAAANGLNYIDVPSANIAADHADPNLIAFMQEDEPDLSSHNWPVSVWSDRYTAIRAVSNKPIYGNFAGPMITVAKDAIPPYDGHNQTKFIPYADWLSHDWYPINRNPSRYGNTPLILAAMDLLKKWSKGKPQMAYVEASDQNVSSTGRSPTPAEMKEQVRAIMGRGALGWSFFVTRLPGDIGRGYQSFNFDPTTPEMRTAMTEVINEFMPVPAPKTQKHILWSDGTWTSV